LSGMIWSSISRRKLPTLPPKYSDAPAMIGVDRLPLIPLVIAATSVHNAHSACLSVQDICAAAAGEPRTPTPTRRAATFNSETAEADHCRPNFWLWMRRVWADWRSYLMIVKPETVVAWHRKGFRLFWTWKIHRGKPGRPRVSEEIRNLIRMMSRNNPRWGAPRIHGELLKLGIEITEPTVAKYMVPLENHLPRVGVRSSIIM